MRYFDTFKYATLKFIEKQATRDRNSVTLVIPHSQQEQLQKWKITPFI